VTIKLRNKASRRWINEEPLIEGIQLKRVFVTFLLFPCLVREVLRLPAGKVAFVCYSRSSRSLVCLAWKQYKLAQVLNRNLISE